jgi:DNA-binding transcriptional LysR family regulator
LIEGIDAVPFGLRGVSDAPPRCIRAAIAGLGVVALPGYVCRDDVRSGALRRVLPTWFADDSTITALIPYRQGLLPSVRVFMDHLAAEFPKAVLI